MTSLECLIQNVSALLIKTPLKDICDYISNYHIDPETYLEYIESNSARYTRNLIYKDDMIDMFVISWSAHSHTKIHNHAKNGCIMKILKGQLTESIYDKNLANISMKTLCENSVGYMSDDVGYHKISNMSDHIAVSLHIYSPPNHITTYFL